jgi:restriction system protein
MPARPRRRTGRPGETARQGRLAKLQQQYERGAARVREQHTRIEELRVDFHTGKRAAVEECVNRILAASRYPSGFPTATAKAIYLAKPRQLLLEYQFPLIDQVIPTEGAWRYNKTKDRLEVTTRPATERRERYKLLLAAITVRTLYELFTADTPATSTASCLTASWRTSTRLPAGRHVRP